MKLKFTKQFKYLLVFLIVVISIVYGKYGNLFNKGSEGNPQVFKIEREFLKSKNAIKTKFKFSVETIDVFNNAINKIENSYTYPTIKKEQIGNTFVYLAEVPDSIYSKVIMDIRNIKSTNTKIENTDRNMEFDPDLKQRLNINITLREKYLSDLKNTKMAYTSDRLRDQLNNVQLSIDSLETQTQLQQHLRKNYLLLVTITPRTSGSKNLFVNTTSFATRFVISIIGLTLFIFVVLIAMNFILRIMSFLGFHTAKAAGGKSYGSYKYGYGNNSYSYGGKGKKRKIKRIYKDAETGEKKEVTTTEDK